MQGAEQEAGGREEEDSKTDREEDGRRWTGGRKIYQRKHELPGREVKMPVAAERNSEMA